MAPAARRVAVGAQQRLARLAEPLLCTGWLTPLPGRLYQTPNRRQALSQEQVIVGVLVVDLEQVVIDVLGRQLGLHAVQAHRLQFEHHQRAGGVLGQGLVDAHADLLARLHVPFNQMVSDQFLCDVHFATSSCG